MSVTLLWRAILTQPLHKLGDKKMHSMMVAAKHGSMHVLEASTIVPSQSHLWPIVFVHGMACSANIWETQLAHTAQTRRSLAIDLRGHGESDPPADGNYHPTVCADDLFAVLDALNLAQIVLVGHSFGSCVALAAAAAHPDRIAQLILVDPPIDFTHMPAEVYEAQLAPYYRALATDDWRSAIAASFRQALTGSTPTTSDQILARLAATPKEQLVGTSYGLFAFHATDALNQYLAYPKSQVHAILAPANNMPFSLHNLHPAIASTTLPNTSHWLMLDDPDAFAIALDACLAAR